eukprot:g227.t1
MAAALSNAEKIKQMTSAILFGDDPPTLESSAMRSQAKVGQGTYRKHPYINKNESTVNFGTYQPKGGPHEHFTSVAKGELIASTHAPDYMRTRPKEGFDRKTANRTNYNLGEERMGE